MAKNNRRRYIPDIIISNAHLSGRSNFSGSERTVNGRVVNSEGNRNFCIDIPDEGVRTVDNPDVWLSAEDLIELGWNVKIHTNSEDGAEPSYYLPVKVNFRFRPPVVWSITGERRVQVDENNVDLLDGRTFRRIDLVIHPSVRQDWDTGDVTVSAYLNEGWFYVATSPFEDAWQSTHPEEFE